MSDYTRVNLAEVKDMAPEFGLAEVNEARFAGRPLEATQLGLAFLRIHPGQTQPFAHRHAGQEEIYVLLSGSAVAHLDDETVELRSMDAVRVSPSVARHFEAGPEGADLLAIGAPAASGGENDAEMVQFGTTA
jgi:mannose-6-phosphate isomerase-like protein (cupin superfamily)